MSALPTGQRFRRAAGIVIPLFSLRGRDDMGTGEIGDIAAAVQWLAAWHHSVLQVLPINESWPDDLSPYDTLSAFAIDPTYISARQVPEVRESLEAQAWLHSAPVALQAEQARAAPERQRRAVYDIKLRLLEFAYTAFASAHPSSKRARRFTAYCRDNAWWLDDYALFRALKDEQRWASWEHWPTPLRERHASALAEAARRLSERIRLFQYVQWIAAEQWGEARAAAHEHGVLLKGDLPFVCGRDSADVWAHPELFDPSGSAGAPPDAFSPTGQAWGLPLYNWPAVRDSNYEWWRQRVRHARQLYDIFRVDHVVGLYRTYAIPLRDGGTAGFVPPDEAVQCAQGYALMGAICEEAGPHSAVVAEDLGTVPDWVRESLTELSIPGYKVFRWEQRDGRYTDPRLYQRLSVATTGTHDTDTLVEWWRELEEREQVVIATLLEMDPASLAWPAVHRAILQRLYDAGSVLTIIPIQDLFGWDARINTPATVLPENWTYRLPVQTAQLDQRPEVRQQLERIRGMIDAAGRAPGLDEHVRLA